METFAFRRFRLRPKTRANRSFEVAQLINSQGRKLIEYFVKCRLRHGFPKAAKAACLSALRTCPGIRWLSRFLLPYWHLPDDES